MNRENRLMKERDEQINELSEGVQHLDLLVRDIDANVKEQKDVITDANKAIEKTQKKMGFVMGKLSKLLKTQDNKQLYTIMVLWAVMMIQIILLII